MTQQIVCPTSPTDAGARCGGLLEGGLLCPRLANVFGVRTILFDCFATPSNSGKTPSLEGWKVSDESRGPGDRRACLTRESMTTKE